MSIWDAQTTLNAEDALFEIQLQTATLFDSIRNYRSEAESAFKRMQNENANIPSLGSFRNALIAMVRFERDFNDALTYSLVSLQDSLNNNASDLNKGFNGLISRLTFIADEQKKYLADFAKNEMDKIKKQPAAEQGAAYNALIAKVGGQMPILEHIKKCQCHF